MRALLHSVYDQPDAASVHAQFDRVLDALADKLPKVAEHLEAARADVLAFTAFPQEVWRQIWCNNPVRHEAPHDRREVESFLVGPSQRPDEAGGSRSREVPREAGAAPTTTGRVGTARRPGPGKRDGQAYECRNQWWNPRKWNVGSNLADLGRSAVRTSDGTCGRRGNFGQVQGWPGRRPR